MANELKHSSVGTTMTQAEFEAIGLHVCNSQATGDLIYASSSSQLSRLGIGSTNAFLQVSGGIPAWTTTPTLGGNMTVGTRSLIGSDAYITLSGNSGWALATKTSGNATATRLSVITGADDTRVVIAGGFNTNLEINSATDKDAALKFLENATWKYNLFYDTSEDKFTLRSTNADGGGTDGNIFTVTDGTDDIVFLGTVDCGANCEANAYTVGGVSGVDFSGAVTNLTVVKGIVTAAS